MGPAGRQGSAGAGVGADIRYNSTENQFEAFSSTDNRWYPFTNLKTGNQPIGDGASFGVTPTLLGSITVPAGRFRVWYTVRAQTATDNVQVGFHLRQGTTPVPLSETLTSRIRGLTGTVEIQGSAFTEVVVNNTSATTYGFYGHTSISTGTIKNGSEGRTIVGYQQLA